MSIIGICLAGTGLTSCLEENDNLSIGTVNPNTHIYEVREAWHGSDIRLTPQVLAGGYLLNGIVISDKNSGNIPDNQVVIQSTAAKKPRGIILVVDGENNYTLGDSLEVDLRGSILTKENGSLQITALTPEHIRKCASGIEVAPLTMDLSVLNIQFDCYESMLVSVNAEMFPLPAPGSTLSGRNILGNDSVSIELYTDPASSFAGNTLQPSANFTGIAGWNGTKKQLRMRKDNDMKYGSGPLYEFFPEDFETPDQSYKNTYAAKVVYLKTGPWNMIMSLLGNTLNRDRFNPTGFQCIRMQQGLDTSAYLQMNFDVLQGASKVTLSYGSYYNDASSTWRLEASQDQGRNWQPVGEWITDASATAKIATFLVDFDGAIRFRVNKKGLGKTNAAQGVENGRLSIEDFTIYKKTW